MADYSNKNKLFVNPYNFVPVTDPVKREQNVEKRIEEEALHTGFFTCNIKAYTPVAIPDTYNKVEDKEVKGHLHYPLFSEDGRIAIPASSLRGPVRSVYETITNSCMVTMKAGEHITRRSNLGTFQPGLLLKNSNHKWELFSAERIPVVCVGTNDLSYKSLDERHTFFTVSKNSNGEKYLIDKAGYNVYNGDRVTITSNGPGHKKKIEDRRTGKIKYREVWGGNSVDSLIRGGSSSDYLFLGESIHSKHAESVFRMKTREDISSNIIEQSIERLEEILTMYRSESVNRNLGKTHFGYKGYERAKAAGRIPVWYNMKNRNLFLSLAAIGRIASNATMGLLSNGHEHCKSRTQLCPACSVFGMVGEAGKGTGGRVRFTKAIQINDIDPSGSVTLKELGAPRNAYLPFYSTNGLDYDKPGASIRGRKYYWHIPKAGKDPNIYTDTEKTKRNATFNNLISPNSEFEFKVFFDDLTNDELHMLQWALTLGGNESNCMYKIGRGKPLGLGSVKITITEWKERACSLNGTGSCYSILDKTVNIEKPTSSMFDKKAWKDLEIILNYNKNDKTTIRYPWVELDSEQTAIVEKQRKQGRELKENVLASHQWFSNFKKDNKNWLPGIADAKNKKLESYPAKKLDKNKDFENKWEKNKTYVMKATGKYRDGRDEKPFFVYLEWEGIEVQIPYFTLKKGEDATFVKKGETFNLFYTELNNNGFPKWKKVHD